MDIPTTKTKVPSHLPKINPASIASGDANPAIKIQTIVENINIKVSKNKLELFNSKK